MTKEEAQEYIDNYISHAILMTEYGNYVSKQIEDFVDKTKNKCENVLEKYTCATTKKVCNKCLSEIDFILKDLEETVSQFIKNEINKLTEEEQIWLEENVAEKLGTSFTYPEKSKSMLFLIPIATIGVVGNYGSSIADKLHSLYEQEIMSSYVGGSDFNKVEEDYEGKFNTFERGLQADSETLGSSLAGQYDRLIYTANAKKIKGYVWSAILDTSTCLYCGSLDGKKFTDISKIPVYPAHRNCRCNLIVYNEETEAFIPESYSKWFEKQSETEKQKILGKKRFELYESGMKIKNFVNNGKITPLKDLKK